MDNKIKIKTLKGGCNIYVVSDGKDSIMIDAGIYKSFASIMEQVKINSIDPDSIKYIILTHTHYDHVGSLKLIHEKISAKIVVHQNEAANLADGFTIIPKGTYFPFTTITNLGRKHTPDLGRYNPVQADVSVNESLVLDNLSFKVELIHTPGHTEGSMSIVIENEFAFVGDNLFGIPLFSAFPPFANDVPTLFKSWKKLESLQCKRYYPGHGKPITYEKLVKEVKKLEKKFR